MSVNREIIKLVDELEQLYREQEHHRLSYNEVVSQMQIIRQTILLKRNSLRGAQLDGSPSITNNTDAKKTGNIEWLKAKCGTNDVFIEQPGLKRKSDLMEIYGSKNYDRIQKLETELQNKFDNFCDAYQPRFWPIESLRD